MEWATGVQYDGRLSAKIQRANGDIELVDVGELGTRGLPTPATTKRRVVVTNFASWSAISADEYTTMFGLAPTGNGHQVFAFQSNGRRYIVPALALMRGFFRPQQHVLPAMFLPQGIERICTPVLREHTVEAVAVMTWHHLTWQNKYSSSLKPLTWMYCVPSARKMCGSIHDNMLRKRIGLDLPIGQVRLCLQTVDQGVNSYVTQLTIITLANDETPFEFAGEQPTHIAFHNGIQAAAARPTAKNLRDTSIRRHADGSTDISDEEWELLRSMRGLHGHVKQQHDIRLLLDGILAKLSLGTAWRKASYKVGTWSNASRLFQKLKATGAWLPISKILQNSSR